MSAANDPRGEILRALWKGAGRLARDWTEDAAEAAHGDQADQMEYLIASREARALRGYAEYVEHMIPFEKGEGSKSRRERMDWAARVARSTAKAITGFGQLRYDEQRARVKEDDK